MFTSNKRRVQRISPERPSPCCRVTSPPKPGIPHKHMRKSRNLETACCHFTLKTNIKRDLGGKPASNYENL